MDRNVPAVSATVRHEVSCDPVAAWAFQAGLDPAEYYPSHGPLPAVVSVRDQSGDWRTSGHERTLELSDGGSVVERLTDVSSPTFFAYDLRDFQKLFGTLVGGARAEWSFERTAAGTSIRWTYTFHPRPARRWIVALIVWAAWKPYMVRVLRRIATDTEAADTGRSRRNA